QAWRILFQELAWQMGEWILEHFQWKSYLGWKDSPKDFQQIRLTKVK
ncbi:MAG: hypothetical protein RL638_584, partial [Bacteroidota bacterium]